MPDTDRRALMSALEDWRRLLLERGRIGHDEKREAFYRHLREVGAK